jgi:hypothetical protein
VHFKSQDVDVALKGLSLFDRSGEYGAIYENGVRAVTSRSNLTNLKGEWHGFHGPVTGAIYQVSVSTNGSFLLFANCSGGYGCFVKVAGSAAFRQCLFVGNSVGAITHDSVWATDPTRLESCYFLNTRLRGESLMAGSVLVDSCLFAGESQSMAIVTLTGVQISFTSTEISFDTASLLPLCDKYGKFETPKGMETPKGTGTPAAGEDHERENVLAARKTRIIPFVVLQLALLALGLTL